VTEYGNGKGDGNGDNKDNGIAANTKVTVKVTANTKGA
jgi:hypothetical protein